MSPSECRRIVIERDGGCVAPLVDKDAGPCYDRWGMPLPPNPRTVHFEIDFIRHGKPFKRHEDPQVHVTLCAGHHRGTGPSHGWCWATSNRPLLRRYLRDHYPDIWRSNS